MNAKEAIVSVNTYILGAFGHPVYEDLRILVRAPLPIDMHQLLRNFVYPRMKKTFPYCRIAKSVAVIINNHFVVRNDMYVI